MKAESIGTIETIDDREDLILVTDSQNVEHLKEYFGNPKELKDFNGFFVRIEDGEYKEIFHTCGKHCMQY